MPQNENVTQKRGVMDERRRRGTVQAQEQGQAQVQVQVQAQMTVQARGTRDRIRCSIEPKPGSHGGAQKPEGHDW